MNTKTIVGLLIALTVPAVAHASGPKAASEILDEAKKASRDTKKPILLIFDASW